MFNLSGSEIVIILLLALVVLGPEKLPDAIRRFGRLYGELKRMSNSFQDEMRSTLDEPVREMRETADLLREQAGFTQEPPNRRSGTHNDRLSADDSTADDTSADDEARTDGAGRPAGGADDEPSPDVAGDETDDGPSQGAAGDEGDDGPSQGAAGDEGDERR